MTVMLPIELILQVLTYVPLCELRNKTLYLNRSWHLCSHESIANRLKLCVRQVRAYEAQKTKLFRPSACILGNFDTQANSQVLTSISLNINAVKNGLLEFSPSGLASFGVWMEHIGFIPITKQHEWAQFAFDPDFVMNK